ncbi:MAG TPA: prefoldin subunit alpha [Candidatus Pacearchaeota archaeon]|nr:prefoldin subunit alpha [archaeon BMS3Abin17]HDK42663.1 prefoldin subunit alpha [Candidatus Pacearchaeota archaeon]HDZ60394.1 prefoldin subunit alpha [Candidatus Pacearchaeota archaeon]
MKMDEAQQELMFKLSMFEQQIQQIQQQLQAVEQGVAELTSLNLGLEELVGSEGKEIMAPIGRGIFVKAKLLSEELIVDVGGKNFVKKSIPDAQKIIKEQTKKLEEVKESLSKSMEEINQELTKTVMDAQKQQEKK